MKHLFILIAVSLLFSKVAFSKVIPNKYITYIQKQISKKDLERLNFDKARLFESNSDDSIICVPYKKGNSFLIFEVKTKKTVFVEFTLTAVQGVNKSNNNNKFRDDKILIYNAKKDSLKKIILDKKTNTICTILEISANQKPVRKVNLETMVLDSKLLSQSIPPVIQHIPDSVDYSTGKSKITSGKNLSILFNIDWFLSFNDFFLLDNVKKTTYVQRFISFTLFKNEIIEVEYSNPENLKPIDLKKAFDKLN